MRNGNVFGSDSKTYNAVSMPLWIEVKEKKLGGGTVSLSGYKKGDMIAAAAPVVLPKMGGDAVILDAFEVEETIDSSATAVKLKKGDFGTIPVAGLIVGKVSDGTASKAATLGELGANGFAITANALGALTAGDKVYICSATGSNKAAVLPQGLTLRDIYVDTNTPTKATVAVVTKGQILADRIAAAIPSWMEKALYGNISFEKEL